MRMLLILACFCFLLLGFFGTRVGRGSLSTSTSALSQSTAVSLVGASEETLLARIKELEETQARLYQRIELREPWDRCLRFRYRSAKECVEGDNPLNDKPPCVLDALKDMGEKITTALERADITHWISYGSLLGATREQHILRWTLDFDVVIAREEYATVGAKLDGASGLEGLRFFYDKKYPDIGRACITERGSELYTKWEIKEPETKNFYNHYPYVDLYSTHEDTSEQRKTNGIIRVRFGPTCTFTANTIFPLKRIEMYGKKYWAPHNTSLYLSQLYGPKFMEPPDNRLRSGHGGYNDACLPEWQPK